MDPGQSPFTFRIGLGQVGAALSRRGAAGHGRRLFEILVRGCGQVIRGWDEGVMTMKKGETATIEMTYDYAYGDAGKGATGSRWLHSLRESSCLCVCPLLRRFPGVGCK